jgi:hypothetical protein
MEKRFVIPAVTFIAAVLIWIALAILHGMNILPSEYAPWPEALFCLVTAVLMFISSARCRQIGGPRGGIIFRSLMLLLLAVYTFWKIGVIAACVLLVAAIASGALAFGKFKQPEETGDSTSTSSQTTEETD